MNELPNGWIELPLEELGISVKGSLQPAHGSRYELWSVPAFAAREPERLAGEQIGSHKRPVEPGDLLICKINPRINRVWTVGARGELDQIASPEWLVLRTGNSALTEFLRWQLTSPTFRRWIEGSVHGVTGSHTRAKDDQVLQFTARIAPEPEQDRIVAAIEEAFSKLDAGEAGLRTVRQLLKRMREAVLAAAVTGRLVRQHHPEIPETRDRAAPGVDSLPNDEQGGPPASWAWAALGDLVEPRRRIAYGVLQPGNDVEGGVPLVRVMDLIDGSVAIPQLKRINPAIASKFPRTALVGGEVLLSVVGTIGRVAVASSQLKGANVARAVAVLPLRPDAVLPEWIACALRHEPWRRALEEMSHEVARKTLNLEDVRRFPVPVPPVEEQARIVAEAERQFSFIDACERAVDLGVARSSALKRSILKAAFQGQLVPQDPSDESASALLERIRAERAASDGSSGRRRKKLEAS